MEALAQKHGLSYEQIVDVVTRREQLTTSFFNEFPTLFTVTDQCGNFIMANDYWAQRLGWNRAQLKEKPLQALICDDCQHKFTDFYTSNKQETSFNCKIQNSQLKYIGTHWHLVKRDGAIFGTANIA